MAPDPSAGGATFQPPFDPVMQATYGPDGTTMTIDRGYIVQETGFSGSGRLGLLFLYNPSNITVSYPSYEGEVALPSGIDPGAPGRLLGVTNQVLNFTIMFDRTLEVVKDNNHPGVNVDIEQLKTMCGMTQENKFTTTRTNPGGNGETTSNATGTGVPMFVPMFFRFGTTQNALRYYGSINNFTVQYSLWAYNMTPTRCEVSIQAALIPENLNFNGGGGSAADDTAANNAQGGGVYDNPDYLRWKYQQDGMR